MNATAIGNLTDTQIEDMSTAQVASLTTAGLEALSSTEVQSWVTTQLGSADLEAAQRPDDDRARPSLRRPS